MAAFAAKRGGVLKHSNTANPAISELNTCFDQRVSDEHNARIHIDQTKMNIIKHAHVGSHHVVVMTPIIGFIPNARKGMTDLIVPKHEHITFDPHTLNFLFP